MTQPPPFGPPGGLPPQNPYGPQGPPNQPGGQPPQNPYGPPGSQGQPGQPPQNPYGPPGQYGPAGGQFGQPQPQYPPTQPMPTQPMPPQPMPGQGGYGAPPPPPPGFGQPPGQPGNGKGNKSPLIIAGAVLGVVAVGVTGWALTRPTSTTVTPTPIRPTVISTGGVPSVTVTPIVMTPSPNPSTTYKPIPGVCSPLLSDAQCNLAERIGDWTVKIESCVADPSKDNLDGIECDVVRPNLLRGAAKIHAHTATNTSQLNADVNKFFSENGVAPSRIGKYWNRPPAKTYWFRGLDKNKKLGALLTLNNAKTRQAKIAWTHNTQLWYAEVSVKDDNVKHVMDWWARKKK